MHTPKKRNLRQRINDSIFNESEFLLMASDWAQKKWISVQELHMIQKTLKQAEVKKLIETWLEILPFSLGITYFRETSAVGAGIATKSLITGVSTYVSTLLVQSIVIGTVAKKKLEGFQSAKVVPWLYFTPVIGDLAPLVYLSRNHPNFLRLLWAYRSSKSIWERKKNTKRTLQRHLYQRLESKKFEKGIRNIDQILGVTNRIWEKIDTVVKTGKKVIRNKKTKQTD